MGREIERKFLVRGRPWGSSKGVLVRQGHLSMDKDRVVRVRTAGEKGFLTVKGRSQGLMRPEYEYEIPFQDAVEMLNTLCTGHIIEKTRYHVEHAGLIWEIDEFKGENQGLVVAEVELESENQALALPAWVGNEVSGDPRYLNVNLAHRPFKRWGKEEFTDLHLS
ncbi:MAG: CYTH domain-containing protein [Desulfobacteraceae bacterium]|nr:MAG: CYTH domain-containing protein [Desulfobacteraceae bacterium]